MAEKYTWVTFLSFKARGCTTFGLSRIIFHLTSMTSASRNFLLWKKRQAKELSVNTGQGWKALSPRAWIMPSRGTRSQPCKVVEKQPGLFLFGLKLFHNPPIMHSPPLIKVVHWGISEKNKNTETNYSRNLNLETRSKKWCMCLSEGVKIHTHCRDIDYFEYRNRFKFFHSGNFWSRTKLKVSPARNPMVSR